LPEDWNKSITVLIYKKADKTDCSNYNGISLLPTTYKILSNILLLRLTPYAEEIIGDNRSVFPHNRSTTHQILFICEIHDNAPARRALATQNKLADLGFHYLDHPPYSPDLAPSDYYLFPGLGGGDK
jgi:histone-lysine N-methyltransferase SETMAR